MDTQLVIAFLVFAFSMCITPGAGNIALLGIANRYGFSGAIPFVVGTSLGVLLVFAGTSAGLLGVLTRYPALFLTLKYAGAAYLLYMAWGISRFQNDANARADAGTDAGAIADSGMLTGALLQILNPKAWIAAMTVFTQFSNPNYSLLQQAVVVCLAFTLVTLLCTSVWALGGSLLMRLLQSPQQVRRVSQGLGLTLAITVVFMLAN
ncbi:LysE family translocator [Aliagarivorans marinus]|uniref:LysE family translocator n=1 Tax=Aliagarivorans marinus TaxID=561965 RepID=UPI000423EDAF|nr:LysE family translocator [Aliagarivorans marinus]